MNSQQWDYVIEWMAHVTDLLEEIAKNTRPEEIDEPKNTITGFSTEKK